LNFYSFCNVLYYKLVYKIYYMENYVNVYLGQHLKDLREKNNMKQTEAAILFGITQQNYSKIECGKVNFSDKILNTICSSFNVTPNDFLNYQHTISVEKIVENKDTDKALIDQLKWRIKMQNLRIADLEIEVRQYRRNFIVGDDGPPIYVMI
jgi:transcriptional regulator with XRE-family HTH domain